MSDATIGIKPSETLKMFPLFVAWMAELEEPIDTVESILIYQEMERDREQEALASDQWRHYKTGKHVIVGIDLSDGRQFMKAFATEAWEAQKAVL